MQAYWLVVRVLLTSPAGAAASQKWKIIYLQVLTTLRSSSLRSTSTLVWGEWKKSCAIKPWPEFVKGLFGGGLSRAMSYKLCGN